MLNCKTQMCLCLHCLIKTYTENRYSIFICINRVLIYVNNINIQQLYIFKTPLKQEDNICNTVTKVERETLVNEIMDSDSLIR